jgi:hypothetical protein
VQPFLLVQDMATVDAMPLFQTGAAAGACGVLCDKYRMSTEGRLFPIIDRIGRRQPLIDEVSRMFKHLWETFILKVALLLRSQMEFLAKWRPHQPGKYLLQISHADDPVEQSLGKARGVATVLTSQAGFKGSP